MSVQIRYMGAKHGIANAVAAVVAGLPSGPCLDLFSGMCSVAGALASSGRETWCNDIQRYAAVVAEALLISVDPPLDPLRSATHLFDHYAANLRLLQDRFAADLAGEAVALAQLDKAEYVRQASEWRHVGNDERLALEAQSLRSNLMTTPYRLATLTFAHGYFGLCQATELDSLRFAIDSAWRVGMLTAGEARWALVALLQAASHLVAAPGHFAEHLKPRDDETYRRLRRLRARSAWTQFQVELGRLAPYGTERWRKGNRVFCEDATTLTQRLGQLRLQPRVVYADPPYSKAQYSRYYHVLETLVRYDYPAATGAGRYRSDRFQTPFSKVSTVRQGFESLAEHTAKLGADLVLSYPSNGLLYAAGEDPPSLLRRHYRSVEVAWSSSKQHSTLGGAPGRANTQVTEMILVARNAN